MQTAEKKLDATQTPPSRVPIGSIFGNKQAFVGTIQNAADPFLVEPSWTDDVYLFFSDVARKRSMAANLGVRAGEVLLASLDQELRGDRAGTLDFGAQETSWPEGRQWAYPSIAEFKKVMYGWCRPCRRYEADPRGVPV
jgi:hypothetical protein